MSHRSLVQTKTDKGVRSGRLAGAGPRNQWTAGVFRRWVTGWLAALTCVGASPRTLGYAFQATGTATSTLFAGYLGLNPQRTSYAFKVYRSGSRWLIHIDKAGEPAKYYEMSFDGEYLYDYVGDRQNTKWGCVGAVKKPSPSDPDWAALPVVPFLWLGLCSDERLATNRTEMVPFYHFGVMMFAGTLPRLKIKAACRRGPPALPGSIEFYHTVKWALPTPPPRPSLAEPKEYRQAVFLATNLMRVGNIELPGTFEAKRYRWPSPNEHRDDLMLAAAYRATLATMTNVCEVRQFAPHLLPGVRSQFYDLRFTDSNTVHWVQLRYEADHWLSPEEARRLPEFPAFAAEEARNRGHQQKYTQNDRRTAGPSTHRLTMRIAFIALVTASALALFSPWLRRLQQQPKSHHKRTGDNPCENRTQNVEHTVEEGCGAGGS